MKWRHAGVGQLLFPKLPRLRSCNKAVLTRSHLSWVVVLLAQGPNVVLLRRDQAKSLARLNESKSDSAAFFAAASAALAWRI